MVLAFIRKIKPAHLIGYWWTQKLGMSVVSISKKIQRRVLDGERIRDEKASIRRSATVKAFGKGLIREYEEYPLKPIHA